MGQYIQPHNLQPQQPRVEESIQALITDLQHANDVVNNNPLEACYLYSDLIKKTTSAATDWRNQTFNVFQDIIDTASDNLIQASIEAIEPQDIQDMVPLLRSQIHRLDNLLNLGFYLHKHQISVIINDQNYTPRLCASKAAHIAPDHPRTQQLLLAVAK